MKNRIKEIVKDYLEFNENTGREVNGWKVLNYDSFTILEKFIIMKYNNKFRDCDHTTYIDFDIYDSNRIKVNYSNGSKMVLYSFYVEL